MKRPVNDDDRAKELEAGVQRLIAEHVRGKHRDLLLESWDSLGDTLEEGENAEAASWSWLFKPQEVLDLVVGDVDHAGFVDRESPSYAVAYESLDLARYAWATAGTPDNRARVHSPRSGGRARRRWASRDP